MSPRPLALLLPLLLLSSACTLSRPLATHAVSYNRTVENAQNEMLLLNVLRAKERMPMYFTRIGSITTGVGYTVDSGSLSLTDPVSASLARAVESDGAGMVSKVTDTKGTGGGDTWGLGFPSVSYTNKPTVSISVLDDEEFVRGTLTPVKPETVYYYWQQGWDVDLLIYLLVEGIKLGPETVDKICPEIKRDKLIRNDPGDGFDDFRSCVDSFLMNECEIHFEYRSASVGSSAVRGDISLSDLIDSHKENLFVTSVREGETTCSTLQRKVPQLRLTCPSLDYKTEIYAFSDPGQEGTPCAPEGESDGDGDLKKDIAVVFRSPQGILAYLGEIGRAWESSDPAVPMICNDETCSTRTPFFVLRSSTACDSALLGATYDGATYIVPAGEKEKIPFAEQVSGSYCHQGHSMEALTLASQLISLQRSGKDLPGPALVQVVGQ